jgi:excisionase family DNA binding protein
MKKRVNQLGLFEAKEEEEKALSNLLTVEELSKVLKVKRSWIYEKVRQGRIPHYKLGKYLRFDLFEIKKWLEGNKNI